MPRTIDLGQIVLTTLRGYHWIVQPVIWSDGRRDVRVEEVFVVTDVGYSHAPEGQRRRELPLTDVERRALRQVFRKYILAAAQEQQVDPEIEPEA